MKNFWVIATGAVVIAVAFLHPAPAPQAALAPVPQPAPRAAVHQPRPAAQLLVVYVAGAVRRPGLYRVAPGSRANDAVLQAGGIGTQADPAAVNLAAPVQDGEEIVVPKPGQCAAPAARRGSGRKHARGRAAGTSQASIDLNAADAAQLAGLPGIGETLAARIVAYRDQNGPFASLDELADVAGMTQRRVDAIAPYLIVR